MIKKNQNNIEFWEKRYKDHGHTGWSDNLIYDYDQFARLNSIEDIIKKISNKNKILDFGCGVGDFSFMLANYFDNVYSFDLSPSCISEAKKSLYPNIYFTSDLSDLKNAIMPASLDSILTVTVLDHILDDKKLRNVISLFSQLLKNNGLIISLEYALDKSGRNIPKTDYQAFRQLSDYKRIFSEFGFESSKVLGFYHPYFNASKSFRLYRFLTRISRKLNLKINSESLSKTLINMINDNINTNSDGYYLKIMMFEKDNLLKSSRHKA